MAKKAIIDPKIKAENEENLHEISGVLSLIHYFAEKEQGIIISPFELGNKYFAPKVEAYRNAIIAGLETAEVVPFHFWDEVRAYYVIEVDKSEFIELLNVKFDAAKRTQRSLKTIALFAEYELKRFSEYYSDDFFSTFPIWKLWKDFLKEVVSGVELLPVKDKLSLKQQILLLDELGFFNLECFNNNVTPPKMGDLLSHLLNRTKKDCETGYSNRTSKAIVRTRLNIEKINELLESIPSIKVK